MSRPTAILLEMVRCDTVTRRPAKRWEASCKACGADLGSYVDEFGAWEARWVHIRSFDHTFKAIGNAAVAVGNELSKLSKLAAVFAPPVQNTYGPAPTRAAGRRTKSDQVNLRVR